MTAKPIALTKEEKKALAELVLSSPFRTFLKVVDGKKQAALVEFANDSLSAVAGTNREDSAKLNLKKAKRYQDFMAITEEISKSIHAGDVHLIEIKTT